MEIEVQCSKNYFKISLSQEAGTSENRKETTRATPKIEKTYIKYSQRIFALPSIQGK